LALRSNPNGVPLGNYDFESIRGMGGLLHKKFLAECAATNRRVTTIKLYGL
jgi:hypothetical protein